MPRLRLTLLARKDLEDIGTYIAADNLEAAERFIPLIRDKCRFLSRHPRLAACYPGFADLRKHSIGSYLIFYRAVRNGIEVIRVLHGARDLQKILKAHH